MSDAVHSYIAEKWLYQTLAADAALVAATGGRIWADVAQEAAPSGVWVLYTAQVSTDLAVVGARIVWSEGTYIVRAMTEGPSYAPLLATAERIHALLHGQRGEVDEGTVISCTRVAPFRLTQTVDGRSFRQLGGFYRVVTQ